MPNWNVTSSTSTVTVEAGGWLDALAAALSRFDLGPGSLERFVCEMNADGSVHVHEPRADVRLRVVRADVPSPAVPEMPRAASLLLLGDPDGEPESVPQEPDPGTDRAVRVFERCSQISSASDERDACTIALAIVRELVPANAGAVLLSVAGEPRLRFLAAFGPRARRVLDSSMPANDGIAGFIHSFRSGVIISDVHRDARFEGGVDQFSGYRTRSLLAVPVQSQPGPIYGCLELLNSPTAFTPDDLMIVQTVASALGAWLRASEDMSEEGRASASPRAPHARPSPNAK